MSVKHDDIIYIAMPLYHMTGGVLGTGQMLRFGATMVLRKKFSVSHFWEDCVQHKCTVSRPKSLGWSWENYNCNFLPWPLTTLV